MIDAAMAEYKRLSNFIETATTPLIMLIVRLWISWVFFLAGLTKIRDWENTVFLFEFEYNVPILSPSVAALMATTFELGMPVLIALGLFTRIAVLPLFGMALIIQFVLGATNPAYDNVEHYYWMMIFALLAIRGPGSWSLDARLLKLEKL